MPARTVADRELTSTTRAALVIMRLMQGDRLTTAQVAALCHMSHMGAWYLMMRLCLVCPLVYSGNVWYINFAHGHK
jgi:hypothetical protein